MTDKSNSRTQAELLLQAGLDADRPDDLESAIQQAKELGLDKRNPAMRKAQSRLVELLDAEDQAVGAEPSNERKRGEGEPVWKKQAKDTLARGGAGVATPMGNLAQAPLFAGKTAAAAPAAGNTGSASAAGSAGSDLGGGRVAVASETDKKKKGQAQPSPRTVTRNEMDLDLDLMEAAAEDEAYDPAEKVTALLEELRENQRKEMAASQEKMQRDVAALVQQQAPPWYITGFQASQSQADHLAQGLALVSITADEALKASSTALTRSRQAIGAVAHVKRSQDTHMVQFNQLQKEVRDLRELTEASRVDLQTARQSMAPNPSAAHSSSGNRYGEEFVQRAVEVKGFCPYGQRTAKALPHEAVVNWFKQLVAMPEMAPVKDMIGPPKRIGLKCFKIVLPILGEGDAKDIKFLTQDVLDMDSNGLKALFLNDCALRANVEPSPAATAQYRILGGLMDALNVALKTQGKDESARIDWEYMGIQAMDQQGTETLVASTELGGSFEIYKDELVKVLPSWTEAAWRVAARSRRRR